MTPCHNIIDMLSKKEDTNVTIKNVYVKGKADKDTIDVSGSGQYALSNFSSMTYGKSYFGYRKSYRFCRYCTGKFLEGSKNL